MPTRSKSRSSNRRLVPTVPVAPQRVKLISGVLIAGLGAGLGLALFLVQLDQSFHTADDLRNLGLPVVGGVSMLGARVSIFRRALSVGTFVIAVVLPCLLYGGLLVRLLKSAGIA